jgi:ArsR family transcriptional regulator
VFERQVLSRVEICGNRALDAAVESLSHQIVLTSSTADVLLRALADPLRARIVELLADEQLCTCHLVEATGARQTNVSNHLRVLREAGVVDTEPAGRFTYYRLRPDAVAALSAHYGELATRAERAIRVRRPCS